MQVYKNVRKRLFEIIDVQYVYIYLQYNDFPKLFHKSIKSCFTCIA